MTFLAYLGLVFFGYMFSVFTWNRCHVISGRHSKTGEPFIQDVLFGLSVATLVASLKYLL